MDEELERLLAERAITRVLCTYSRGADRLDLGLMRSCYWPDGTDDHGSYSGGLDGFIEFVGPALQRFEPTNHFLGNILIDLANDLARAETYSVAYHRFHDADGREMDMVAGLRYVDRFERRAGEWCIAKRVCAFEWRRTDPVAEEGRQLRRHLHPWPPRRRRHRLAHPGLNAACALPGNKRRDHPPGS